MKENLDLLKKFGSLSKWSKYSIVCRFPHADELSKLEIEGKYPKECIRSDLHWLYNGKIYFITIGSSETEEEFIFSGVVFDVTNAEGDFAGSISVGTDAKPLYTHTVDSILDQIASWMEDNPEKLRQIYEMPEDPESFSKFCQIIDEI